VIFWHRFLAPLQREGLPSTMTPERLWERAVRPGLDEHMGPIFEAVCRDFLRSSEGLSFLPQRVGSWWNHDATEEVDAVAVGEGESLVAECKLGRHDLRYLETLRRRAHLVADEIGGAPSVHLALFTAADANDVGPHLREEVASGRLLLYDAADLLQGLGP